MGNTSQHISHIYHVVHCVCRGLDFSSPWRASYESARASLEKNLYVTHPVMKEMLRLWDKYRDCILLDLSQIRYVRSYLLTRNMWAKRGTIGFSMVGTVDHLAVYT